jgi:hypothetical protein
VLAACDGIGSAHDSPEPSSRAMINRAALVIKYREPFVDWINDADDDPDMVPLTLEDANADNQVYLIDLDDAEALEEWLDLNHQLLFENELEAWYEDEDLWPTRRDRDAFDAWFDVECHMMLYDVGTGDIVDDER